MRSQCNSGSKSQTVWLPRYDFVLLILVLLVGTYLPSMARAECGDYVMRGENRPGSPSTMAPAPAGQHTSHLPVRDDSPGQPCRGPHCSKSFPSPSMPPLTTPPPRAELWGSIIAAVFVPDCLSMYGSAEESRPFPRPLGHGIYHPPRS
jgi:hypothetical protein